jgi:hypothetical protein
VILHPPVLALLLVALLSALALAWAGVFSVQLLRHWNLASGARRQLELERRSYLVSTVLGLVMLAQGIALPLMVFNADRTAALLVGAMCAFGSFNASVYGFAALYAKTALFFVAGIWLVLHRADLLGPDYPLTRRKYTLLLLMLPLALADAGLSLAYFLDLKTDTLTSCCGTAFHADRHGLGAGVAALDPRLALGLLATTLALTLAVGWAAPRRPALALAYGGLSAVVFVVALVAVVSAVSIYLYENPHHHCPFCLLKREYGHVGFALYAPLFAGTLAGLASGVLSLRKPPSLTLHLPGLTRRLRGMSMAGFGLFGALCALVVWRSALHL